jgi:hypothetical protein
MDAIWDKASNENKSIVNYNWPLQMNNRDSGLMYVILTRSASLLYSPLIRRIY